MRRLLTAILVIVMITCTIPIDVTAEAEPPAWSQASSWAVGELTKADNAGLIPDILKGADLTKPITREEFCELALLLYEKGTGNSPAPASPNPFTDTKNPQVLKAFALGITTGTSATTFSPQVLINREQCAAMLFRAIKAIHPDGDYSVAGIPDFPDQKHISSYAVEAAKYMSKLGIVKGDAKGYFMHKATTDEQTAAGYGMAAREAAILMSVRTYEQIDTIKAAPAEAPVEAPAPESGSIVGKWGKGMAGARYNAVTRSFEFGAYGTEHEYQFNSDGTFTQLIKTGSGSVISITGDYTTSGGMLTLTYKSSKESSDFGNTWTAGNVRPPASYYYEIGKDGDDSYLMIGSEGAAPPLEAETNAAKYWLRQ